MQKTAALLLLFLLAPPSWALDPLVDSAWLMAHREDRELFLLDIQDPDNYRRVHIPDAINAPYNQWRTDKKSSAPGMLPPVPRMERLLANLGIDNNSAVVIIARGNQPGDMAAASRVFWTLKVLGHAQVAILNGGLVSYAEHYPRHLENTPHMGKPTRYQAALNIHITANREDVQAAVKSSSQLLDARTLGEYIGVVSVKPNERPGTIPGAKHLPFDWLVSPRMRIRDKAAIATLFKYAGLNPNQDGTIHFCHTGNRAALSWFVDFAILGHRNAKLYDASMSEWSTNKGFPMETRIEF